MDRDFGKVAFEGLAGGDASEEVVTAQDDGITQKVSTRVSAAFAGSAELPSPLVLEPYRTFLEIDQPESEFVVRAKKREGQLPTLALHLADGGQWKLVAIERIKKFLAEALPTVTIIA